MSRMATLLIVILASGCGGTSAGGHETTPDAHPARTTWLTDDDHLAVRMREVGALLDRDGLSAGGVWGRGFLATRASDTRPVTIPPDTCISLIALATAGIGDLDATLFAPSGEVIAEDVEPDAHPTVQVCGGHDGRRAYYQVQAYEGAGAFLFASFAGPRAAFEVVARAVGGHPGVASDEGDADEEDARVREFRIGVARRGFRPVRDPEDVPLASDQRVRAPLSVEGAHCYTVGAFAGDGLTDVDLRVLDEDGTEVARDVSPAKDPAAQFCVDGDGDFAVELHAKAGAGQVRLVLFKARDSVVGGESGLWLGTRRSATVSSLPLADTIARVVAAARAHGYGPESTVARGTFGRGEALADEVSLAADRCTRLVAAGGRGVRQIAVRVLDETGAELGSSDAITTSPSVRLCPERRMRVEVQLVSRGGQGDYALLAMTRAPPEPVANAPAEDRGALLGALEDAEEQGYRLTDLSRVALGPDGSTVALDAPGCGLVAAVAAGSGGSVGAKLLRGDRTAARAGGRTVTFRVCAQWSPRLVLAPQGTTRTGYVLRFTRRTADD